MERVEQVSRSPDAAIEAERRGRLRYYVEGQSTGWLRYVVEQALMALFGGIPSLVGIGLRALAYRLILHADGAPAIEDHVRLAMPANIHLGRAVYLDHGVYLHACPRGIWIGDRTFVMHRAELHVYNFRGLPHAGIWIGTDCFVGEACIVRGQGGVHIGDGVLLAPGVQILAVDHLYADPHRPIIRQGIRARGIVVEDGAWIGAGAILLDGVRVGRNAVVGAGAVVTRDVPAWSVVAGVPAQVIRRRDVLGEGGYGDDVALCGDPGVQRGAGDRLDR